MRPHYLLIPMLAFFLPLPVQTSLAGGANEHPVFKEGLVKDAPPGMQNPNDIGSEKPIANLQEASPKQQDITKKAFEYVSQVVSAEDFKSAVYQMKISSCYQDNYYDSDFKYSNQAVYKLLLVKSPFTLNVIWYDGEHPKGKGSNQGYEVEIYDNTIGVNENAVAQETSPEKQAGFLASLILHESSHVSGFRHPTAFKWPPSCWHPNRNDSVPYKMNVIYDDVAAGIGLPVPQY